MKKYQDLIIEKISNLLMGCDLDKKHAKELVLIVLPKILAVGVKLK